jgi:hypothetical protein
MAELKLGRHHLGGVYMTSSDGLLIWVGDLLSENSDSVDAIWPHGDLGQELMVIEGDRGAARTLGDAPVPNLCEILSSRTTPLCLLVRGGLSFFPELDCPRVLLDQKAGTPSAPLRTF